MKKLFLLLALSVTFIISGCWETYQEFTVKADGSGEMSMKVDMSSMMAMITQMAEMENPDEEKKHTKMDTSFSLSSFTDTASSLSAEEKALLRDGVLNLTVDTEEGKLFFGIKFPFKKLSDVNKISKMDSLGFLDKALEGAFKNLDSSEEMMEEDDDILSFPEEYYEFSAKEGEIKRTLNKERYARLAEDKGMQSIKDAMADGMPAATSKYVVNLPRPAKKTEGKNVKLSSDRKTVTIESSMESFFEDPSSYEFLIEY